MVTDSQLLKAVRSLNYRRRLDEKVPKLENTILRYMKEKDLSQIAIPIYHVLEENKGVIIYEVPFSDPDQLKIKFNRYN